MKCLSHVPYASWRLSVFRRLFISSVPPCRAISSQAKHSNNDLLEETPAPRPSDQLPQSPLLSNPHVDRVKRHKKRTATAEDLKGLQNNPWARMLASPLRMCSVTGVRTPRDLLTTWGLVRRSESEGLWLLPISLLKDELKGSDSLGSQESLPAQSKSQSPWHLQMRLIDNIQMLRRLSKSLESHEIGNFSALSKTIPYRFKHPQGPLSSRDTRSLVWRQDMPAFVLGRMRLEAMKQLKKVSKRKHQELGHENGVWKAIDIEGEMSEDALRKGLDGLKSFERMECGVVLLLEESQGEQSAMNTLPQLMALSQTGSCVPILDLSRLLSESEREELRRADPRFQRAALFFRPDDHIAMNALLALWKLRGYLNEDIKLG